MRCPKCNFENRPDARFCKRCGQPLAATTAPPVQVTVCPACGATVKPGARFCPRCGQPLPAIPPAQPQGYAQPPAQPPSPAQPYAQPPAPAQSQGYAQPPAAPPPLAAQPPQKRKLPRWVLWAGGAAAVLLCIIATVMAIKTLKPAKEEAPATPTTVETAAVEAPAIATATAEPLPAATSTNEPLPVATPTNEPLPVATPTNEPLPTATPAPVFDAQVTTIPLTSTVRVGDSLTVTVTLTNKGNVSLRKLRYQLSGGWESALELVTDTVVSHDDATVSPGEIDAAIFIFKGLQAGDVTFHMNVTLEVQEESPRWESLSSEVISVSVTQ